jgi:hypothetical protein
MTRTALRRTAQAVTAAVAALTGLLPGPAIAGHAAGHAGKKWIVLSSDDAGNTATTPSIARFGDGSYEVVWVAQTGVSAFALEARRLSASGQPIGKQIVVLPDWLHLAGDPTVLADNGVRVIGFGGDETGTSGSHDNGAEYYLTSSDGAHWTLGTGSLSAADGANRDAGTAVIADGGTLITGLAVGGGVQYHVGASTSNPAPGPDPATARTGSESPGLGVDSSTGQVWAVWHSGTRNPATGGVNAQVISPSVGSRVQAPGSANRHGDSAPAPQDLSVAARIGGGAYTAYPSPSDRSIQIWRLGTPHPAATVDVTKYGAGSVVVTPAPGGRLWLYWRDGNGWEAARSNPAANRFGAAHRIRIPARDSQDVAIAADGSAGPLEAVATVTTAKGRHEIVARRVLPQLLVSAPTTVKRHHSFTATVTDAGAPVRGTQVSFNGRTQRANRHGKARFHVTRHTGLGGHVVTARASGFAVANGEVTVVS